VARSLVPLALALAWALALDTAAAGEAAQQPARQAARRGPAPPEAVVLFAEGVQLELQGKYTQAIAKLEKALALDKDAPEVLYELGFCLYRLGKNKEAAQRLERALALDPRNGTAHETLAFVYNALADRDKALEQLEAAARAPDRPRNHQGLVRRLAWIYQRQGDYKNAIEWYKYALECGYRDLRTYLALGTLQLKEKLYDDALASFRQVVRHSPADEAQIDDIAAAYGQLTEAQRTDALRRYEPIAEKSDDPATLEAIALAYQAAGRTSEMLRTLERAASLASPRTETQKEFLAAHFENTGDLPRAIAWRRRIIQGHKHPTAEQFTRLAALYVRHEEMEKAAEAFRKAMAAEPSRSDLLRRVADCYSELYQWDKAAAALEKYLEARKPGPADARDIYELADIYRQAGKTTLARQRKKQAFDLLLNAIGKSANKKAEVQVHLALAELYYADRQPEKALDYLRVAQQLDPDDPRKLLLLAAGYKRVQKWADAAATLARYVRANPKSIATAAALFEPRRR